MTDTCRITKPGTGSRGAINPTTGQYDSAPAAVTVYEGACRLGRANPTIQQAVAGDASWDVQDSLLHLPLDSTTEGVAAGQTVVYLSSADNPALVGAEFGVLGVVVSTQVTARRCLVRQVVQ
jgi:hypothetical protein